MKRKGRGSPPFLKVVQFFLWTALISKASSASADPVVKISMARSLSPWQQTIVRVALQNSSAKPVLPVWVGLESAAGKLMAWGHKGSHSIWMESALGRRKGRGFEVLFTPPLPQQMTGPINWPRTDARLVRIRPVFRGEVSSVTYRLQASYNHGGRLKVTMRYLVLDPRSRPVCLLSGPVDMPRKAVFRPCNRVQRIGAGQKDWLYMEEAELVRGTNTVRAEARFVVRRPPFDLPRARKKARITSGPVGYDTKEGRWILVDPRRPRTLVVPNRGPVVSLPGDWLIKLLELNESNQAHVYWSGRTVKETESLKRDLDRLGIQASFFVFKGSRSSTRLNIWFNRKQVLALARFMKRKGAWMKGYGVVWAR